MMTIQRSPIVSVIITTKNSGSTLRKCLESIVNQSYYDKSRIEIIVVDNHSVDDTREIAQEFDAKVLIAGPERTAQVNLGAQSAIGKYVYWVASDWVLDASVIEEAVLACEKWGYDAIAIHNVSDPTVSFWSKVRRFERDFYVSDPLIMTPDFFRRKMYLDLGGYNESLVACEEYEFHERIVKAGFRIGGIRGKEVHIGEPRNLREVVTKHYYYGKTLLKYIETDHSGSMKRLSPIRRGFVKEWRRFLDDPVLTSGFLLYQFVRYTSVGLGLLSSL